MEPFVGPIGTWWVHVTCDSVRKTPTCEPFLIWAPGPEVVIFRKRVFRKRMGVGVGVGGGVGGGVGVGVTTATTAAQRPYSRGRSADADADAEKGSQTTKKMVSGHQTDISGDLPAILGQLIVTRRGGASRGYAGPWGPVFS